MSDFGGRIPTSRKEAANWWDLLDDDLKVKRKKRNFYYQNGEFRRGDELQPLNGPSQEDEDWDDWVEI